MNSHKLIAKKLEDHLTKTIMDIDRDNKQLLTFYQLGRLLSQLDII